MPTLRRAEEPSATERGGTPYGLSVREALAVPALARARVLAGDDGLSRIVQRVNVMEVPDILPWVKPYELLLTTGYPLRDTPDGLVRLVGDLAHRGLAAVLIKPGRYIDELPAAMLAEADRHGLPIVELPAEVGFDDILNQVLTEILNRQAAVLARSEEVHRALIHIVLEGGGLDEVAAELVGLVGDTVLVTTSDGQVLSRAGEEVGPPFDVAYFDANGRLLVEQLIGGGGALADDDRGVGLVPVVAAGLEHGRLAVLSPSRPLDESDVHILERAAAVAALVITNSSRCPPSRASTRETSSATSLTAGPATPTARSRTVLRWAGTSTGRWSSWWLSLIPR
jgi:Purine catabolism regulatory protein-like family